MLEQLRNLLKKKNMCSSVTTDYHGEQEKCLNEKVNSTWQELILRL